MPTKPESTVHKNDSPNSGETAGNTEAKLALLSLVAPAVPGIVPTVQPLQPADHAVKAQLIENIASEERQRDESIQKRTSELKCLSTIERKPKHDPIANTRIILCLAALLFLSLFSWFNGAQFVAKNFSNSYWEGLIFCSVIPAIPFMLKYFFATFLKRQSFYVELILVGLFLIGFVVFSDQFAGNFTRTEGIPIPASPIDLSETGTDTPVAPIDPYAPISLRWFFFGQLILETIASFIFATWLLNLLALRPDPLWDEIEHAIAILDKDLAQRDSIIAELRRKLTELEHREVAHNALKAAFNHLLK